MTKLTLQGITHPGSLELADGMISLGRNPTNDFRVSDPTVSSFHCELIISADSVLVRDLSSTNGTFIENKRIEESSLRPGQVLRLGEAEMRLVSSPKTQTEARSGTDAATTKLLEGQPACVNHPGVAGVIRCKTCHKVFCSACSKPVGLRGGQPRLFCPSCAQPCESIAPSTEEQKKPSFLGRLTQTIRIRRRHN